MICEYFINKNRLLYFISKILLKRKQLRYGVFIEPGCFGVGLCIMHTGGIVVNPKCIIGKNCTIHQNVTLGNDGNVDKAPIIGDNCLLGANSCVIGDISLGNSCVVGAGAVVTKSFPKNCVLVGIPAKRIR